MKSKLPIQTFMFLCMLLSTVWAKATVQLPALVSDGMVLQRDRNINIWGTADPGEKINIEFNNRKFHTAADAQGHWITQLPAMKAGGPFIMIINNITIKDILIGDVWLASGQSNMELPMYRVAPLYQSEIKNADNTQIRFFTVPQQYNFKAPQQNLKGGKWEITTPQSITNFSAVAYFFAKKLQEDNHIPVGIIHSSLGGSPVQAWMDTESLKKYPEYIEEAKKWQNDELIRKTETTERDLSGAWYAELDQRDIGLQQHWENPDLNDAEWTNMNVPGSWQDKEGVFEGSVWFRKEIRLPEGSAGAAAFLNLGRIKDADVVYINGKKIGNTTYEYPPRWYKIPSGILKEGKNIIAVRVINGSGRGQFVPDKPYYLEINGKKYDLTGIWKYKTGAKMEHMAPGQTFIRWMPTGLYNAMINPLLNYKIKGTIWYQGESNTGKPQEYQDLLTTMILDWRNKWNEKDMPFLIVQLANFMENKTIPEESNWAALREAQRQVSLHVPNTGLAVAIDIGEWNDIHPLNKKTVGDRLALQAEKIAYGKNIVADGPIYQSMKKNGNKVILSFKRETDHFKNPGKLKGFSVKDEMGTWRWAEAEIQGKNIVVWNAETATPTAVRYDWADNPNGNLTNIQGLPASPFTTESTNRP
ncbi:sialate O-acetylesterase [Daejeonia sp. YH14]|uniref:sialate O-acetylesterase n=1 Tax=Daejeonia sp. YH14 TaxID=3439042 RepID=UPI003F49088C